MDLSAFGIDYRIEPIEPDWTFLTLGGEQWLVIFTLALVAATAMLWWATRALVVGAERSAKIQLRAYIGIEHIWVAQPRARFPGESAITFKNFGTTPAHNVSVGSLSKLTGAPEREEEAFSGELASSTTLSPGQTFKHMARTPTALGEGDISNFEGRLAMLFTVGRLTYEDAFGEIREVRFRYWADQDGAHITPVGNSSN